jgi:hypothetical protein
VIACNGTIVNDSEMGEVIQLQGDQRKDVQEFLVDKNGLELDAKTIKVSSPSRNFYHRSTHTYISRFTGSKHFTLRATLSCSDFEDR